MRHVHRLALAAMLSLALPALALAAPSLAQNPAGASSEQIAELDTLNAQIAEQTKAANYSEALALAETAAEKARASVGEESTQFARAISSRIGAPTLSSRQGRGTSTTLSGRNFALNALDQGM